tara:strand:+ start:59 stop:199 length:141 start_codon:yes stop_codon:yes gene_type:complete
MVPVRRGVCIACFQVPISLSDISSAKEIFEHNTKYNKRLLIISSPD